jgi:hypothetical protein
VYHVYARPACCLCSKKPSFLPRTTAGPGLSLVLEVWDASGEGGSGVLLGAGKAALPPLQALKERDEQAVGVALSQVGGQLHFEQYTSI